MPTRSELEDRAQQLKAEVDERAREIKRRAKRLKREARDQAREMQGGLQEKVKAHPLLFAGAALGAGFVLGGGLRATVTGPLMRMGGGMAWKFIVLPALTATLTRALGVTGSEEDAQS